MRQLTLNRVFGAYLVFFVLLIAGILPRETVAAVTFLLLVWMAWAPLEQGVLFAIRAVPLFVAIPLTASYDNLNMWRLVAIVLLVRLLCQRQTRQELARQWHAFGAGWLKTHPVTRRLAILAALAALSLIGAHYLGAGVKRIVYFANLLMIPVVLWTLLRRGTLHTQQVISSIALSAVIVIVVGYLQLLSTYLIDIYAFMRVWGEGIQLRQFGTQWSYIAVYQGNTWLAYYGPQLSLRVFSLFTDSHTFPLYVLLALPALFAQSLGPVLAVAQQGVRAMVRTRARMSVLWVAAALLMVILSGTRGMWAAGLATFGVAVFWWLVARRASLDKPRRNLGTYLALYLFVFVLLFAIAWPIFVSPQFLLSKGDWLLLGNRLHSIVDFGETSNAARILIWKASLQSIAHHPLLGVGIGNFPVVLDQNIFLAKAGSTAHNVYLHVATEMGLVAAAEFIILLGSFLVASWRWMRSAEGPALIYSAGMLLCMPWVFIYLLTDAALFDERAFLAFGIAAAVVLANDPPHRG